MSGSLSEELFDIGVAGCAQSCREQLAAFGKAIPMRFGHFADEAIVLEGAAVGG